MIWPSKYLDLQTSVLRLSAFILEEFRHEPIILLRDLADRVDAFADGKGHFNFFPALNLLFLMGRLEYDDSGDLIQAMLPERSEAA